MIKNVLKRAMSFLLTCALVLGMVPVVGVTVAPVASAAITGSLDVDLTATQSGSASWNLN